MAGRLRAAQVVFAEAQRGALRAPADQAIKVIYAMLLPTVAAMLIIAPYMLRLFGKAYTGSAAGRLRLLAVGALMTGGIYRVDSALIARNRTNALHLHKRRERGYGPGDRRVPAAIRPHGGALGWMIAQGASLAIGAAVVATVFCALSVPNLRHRQG